MTKAKKIDPKLAELLAVPQIPKASEFRKGWAWINKTAKGKEQFWLSRRNDKRS
jgi:hypothetical protein